MFAVVIRKTIRPTITPTNLMRVIIYLPWDVVAPVGRGGALVETITFNRRGVGSTPTLVVT